MLPISECTSRRPEMPLLQTESQCFPQMVQVDQVLETSYGMVSWVRVIKYTMPE